MSSPSCRRACWWDTTGSVGRLVLYCCDRRVAAEQVTEHPLAYVAYVVAHIAEHVLRGVRSPLGGSLRLGVGR